MKLIKSSKIQTILKFRIAFRRLFIGDKNRAILSGIISIALLISMAHYIAADRMDGIWLFLHTFLRRMYFLPVLLAAFWGGKKAAIITSIFVTILYLPHAVLHWPNTLSARFDNVSEIVLLWIVGGISGTLSDKIKYYSSEKIRLSILENVSNVLSLINSDIMVDYKACYGLATALGKYSSISNGSHLSAKILLTRLERLGSHLVNLQDLVLPEPYKKRNCSIKKLIEMSIDTTTSRDHLIQIEHLYQGQIPHLILDEKRMHFALTNIIKSLIHYDNTTYRLSITVKRKLGSILIYFDTQNDNGSTEKWDLFKLYANPEGSYAFSLALSIIRSHGGKFEINNSKDNNSLKLYLPIRYGGRFSE